MPHVQPAMSESAGKACNPRTRPAAPKPIAAAVRHCLAGSRPGGLTRACGPAGRRAGEAGGATVGGGPGQGPAGSIASPAAPRGRA
jgi:hypothetical protein